jgi:hypothetical protein
LVRVAIAVIVFAVIFELASTIQNHLWGASLTKAENDAIKNARDFISQNETSLPNNVKRILNTALKAKV